VIEFAVGQYADLVKKVGNLNSFPNIIFGYGALPGLPICIQAEVDTLCPTMLLFEPICTVEQIELWPANTRALLGADTLGRTWGYPHLPLRGTISSCFRRDRWWRGMTN